MSTLRRVSAMTTQISGYARFLEDIVEAMAPEVTGESKVACGVTICAGEGGDGVLGKTSFKNSDVVVRGWNSLRENGQHENDGETRETKEHAAQRDDTTAPPFGSLSGWERVGGESGVLTRKDFEWEHRRGTRVP